MAIELPTDLPIRPFTTANAWEAWLTTHAGDAGVWLKIAKKASGVASVTCAEALDVALCHGWIDGQKRGCDAGWFLQLFTPRRPRGLWSKINVAHVERLTAAGRTQPAGQRAVQAAQADGRWAAAYAGAAAMAVPDELAAALAQNAQAQSVFEGLGKTARYSICWRVHTAKKPETRLARAQTLVDRLASGERLHG